MVTEGVSSWAGEEGSEGESIERQMEEIGEGAAGQGYYHSSHLSILAAIAEELRMIRCHQTGVEYLPIFPEGIEYEEEDDTPFDEIRDVIPSSIPRNLGSEKEIQDFYAGQLKELMSSREAENLEIMVEESQVVIKTGFVDPERYAPLSAKLRELGGEYIREPGNWRWIMPLP